MNRPEKNFYESFKRTHKDWFWQRLEDSITSGIPDTLVVPRGEHAVFIEFKAIPASNVQIRASQAAWITAFSHNGGTVWVFNKCPKTNTIQGWLAPFKLVEGRKGHAKIDADPTILVSELKKLKPHHLTKPSRRLV